MTCLLHVKYGRRSSHFHLSGCIECSPGNIVGNPRYINSELNVCIGVSTVCWGVVLNSYSCEPLLRLCAILSCGIVKKKNMIYLKIILNVGRAVNSNHF